jgi:prepilin-type processing-associated H-X9-DG protein
VRIADIIDGTSNTILLYERSGGATIYFKTMGVTSSPYDLLGKANGGGWADFLGGENWTKGCLYDGNVPPNGGPCAVNCSNMNGAGLHCFHTGGAHILLADGSVRFLSENVAQFTLAGLITIRKSEIFGEF